MSSVEMEPPRLVCHRRVEALASTLVDVRWIVQIHLHLDHTGAVASIERFPERAGVSVRAPSTTFAMAPEATFAMVIHQGEYDKPGSTGSSSRNVRTCYGPLRRRCA